MFLDVQKEFPVFQFVSIVTGHTWKETQSISFALSLLLFAYFDKILKNLLQAEQSQFSVFAHMQDAAVP